MRHLPIRNRKTCVPPPSIGRSPWYFVPAWRFCAFPTPLRLHSLCSLTVEMISNAHLYFCRQRNLPHIMIDDWSYRSRRPRTLLSLQTLSNLHESTNLLRRSLFHVWGAPDLTVQTVPSYPTHNLWPFSYLSLSPEFIDPHIIDSDVSPLFSLSPTCLSSSPIHLVLRVALACFDLLLVTSYNGMDELLYAISQLPVWSDS
jgi:hypothetical protein